MVNNIKVTATDLDQFSNLLELTKSILQNYDISKFQEIHTCYALQAKINLVLPIQDNKLQLSFPEGSKITYLTHSVNSSSPNQVLVYLNLDKEKFKYSMCLLVIDMLHKSNSIEFQFK